jgi:enolase
MKSPDSITRIHAREVLDSRGNPTIEVEITCRDGAFGRAMVPSGASTGRHEAVELRDGDDGHFAGMGVVIVATCVNEEVQPALLGMPAGEQKHLDRKLCELDGTPNKSRLGANAILGISLAAAHAAAASKKQPLWKHLGSLLEEAPTPRLPMPMVNLLSGGKHAGGNLDFQDFMLLPIGAESFSQALEMTVAVYRALGQVLIRHGFEGTLVGDEGGFGPRLHSNEQAVDMCLEAMHKAGLQPGKDAALAIDVASTHFHHGGHYHRHATAGCALSSEEMAALLGRWIDNYPILSIEDGMAEDDWHGWKALTELLGRRVQLVGDDLFVTNPERLKRGSEQGVANSILVKLNQIGTLSETLDVLALARSAGYRPVISARSGETEDNTIADLAVGTGAGQIKIGSVARSERLAKYNQLLRIEEELGATQFSRWDPVSA